MIYTNSADNYWSPDTARMSVFQLVMRKINLPHVGWVHPDTKPPHPSERLAGPDDESEMLSYVTAICHSHGYGATKSAVCTHLYSRDAQTGGITILGII